MHSAPFQTDAPDLGGVRLPRRDVHLPEEDEVYLDATGYLWETIAEATQRWVVVEGVPLPPGYTATETSIGVLIAPGYPAAPLDMAYFTPPLALASGRAVPNAGFVATVGGRQWQGWSRHRTVVNPWQIGVDSLKTHLALVRAWLEAEPNR